MKRFRRAAVRGWLLAKKVHARLRRHPPVKPLDGVVAGVSTRSSLEGTVVLITGASRGIGAALATAFAAAGAHVVACARGKEELERIVAGIRNDGGQAIAIAGDVTQVADIERLVGQACSHFGGIDVLINNVGVLGSSAADAFSTPITEWEAVWRVNVASAIGAAQAAAGTAVERNRPLRIINVSSGIVGHASARLGPYAASKEALESVTRAMALDDATGLISVCAIQPRSVKSDLTKSYYGSAIHTLLDEAQVVGPVFLWAATAAAPLVNGRTFSDPAFTADRAAAIRLRPPFHASAPIGIFPVTFAEPGLKQLPGAYMHLLENAEGFSLDAAIALRKAAESRELFRYPDPQYRELTAAIANENATDSTHVLVAPGSSELIDRILRLFTVPGDEIVMTKPTWSFFHAFVQRWQVLPVAVDMRGRLAQGDLQHDLQALLAAVTPRTRLLYLVNPCNPCGTMADPVELREFLRSLPGHVVAVIDEAYVQYADAAQVPQLMSTIEACEASVILLRTFSKFFGLSGMRLGYALGRPETMALLSRADLPFSIATPAVIAGQAVLADTSFRQSVWSRNAEGRQQLTQGLAKLGLAVQPSQTNFLLFDAPVDPAQMRMDLRQVGLVIPQVEQFFRNYMLLSVGRAEHNAQILDYLSRH